jgi:hypothetical protein
MVVGQLWVYIEEGYGIGIWTLIGYTSFLVLYIFVSTLFGISF